MSEIFNEHDTGIMDGIADRVFERLREGAFRLPPQAVKMLEPFGGYYCPPVQVGYGTAYCILKCLITKEGGLFMQLQSPYGDNLWEGTLIP